MPAHARHRAARPKDDKALIVGHYIGRARPPADNHRCGRPRIPPHRSPRRPPHLRAVRLGRPRARDGPHHSRTTAATVRRGDSTQGSLLPSQGRDARPPGQDRCRLIDADQHLPPNPPRPGRENCAGSPICLDSSDSRGPRNSTQGLSTLRMIVTGGGNRRAHLPHPHHRHDTASPTRRHRHHPRTAVGRRRRRSRCQDRRPQQHPFPGDHHWKAAPHELARNIADASRWYRASRDHCRPGPAHGRGQHRRIRLRLDRERPGHIRPRPRRPARAGHRRRRRRRADQPDARRGLPALLTHGQVVHRCGNLNYPEIQQIAQDLPP